MPKKGFKWSEEEKYKRSIAMKKRYEIDKNLRKKVGHKGSTNPKYIDGRTLVEHKCIICGKRICYNNWRHGKKRCVRCRSIVDGSFKNKKHKDETKKIIGKKSKAKFTEEYLKRVRKVFEERGYWIPLDKVDPYKLYYRQAKFSKEVFYYLNNKDRNKLKKFGLFSYKNSRGVVRDHKFSVKSGFILNVPPIILRHPVNCRIIFHKENVSNAMNKRKKDDIITLKKLFSLIKNFKKPWIEQEGCIKAMKEYLKKENVKAVGGEL